jgi:hypothetical protein
MTSCDLAYMCALVASVISGLARAWTLKYKGQFMLVLDLLLRLAEPLMASSIALPVVRAIRSQPRRQHCMYL